MKRDIETETEKLESKGQRNGKGHRKGLEA